MSKIKPELLFNLSTLKPHSRGLVLGVFEVSPTAPHQVFGNQSAHSLEGSRLKLCLSSWGGALDLKRRRSTTQVTRLDKYVAYPELIVDTVAYIHKENEKVG